MEIITLKQKDKWTEYVHKSIAFDFYHTWYYHSLDKSGEPILFVHQEGKNFVAFPLIKRKIVDTSFSDLTSVYGYTGPISNRNFEELPDQFIENFKSYFLNFLKSEQHVSVFSRLHPLINQEALIKKFGGIYKNGKTVMIDLTKSIEIQRSKYPKSYRNDINQLRDKGYYIKQANSINDVRAFLEIYTENMKRVEASKFYFFNLQYFINLLQSSQFNCKLVLVYAGEKPIAGSVIVFTNKIIQSHLVATGNEFLKESPAKFLTDEISILGRKLGMKYYHLGGGVGFQEDSLFRWKAGFSDTFLNYHSWRYIVDEPAYNALVDGRGLDPNSPVDFFPLYRNMS